MRQLLACALVIFLSNCQSVKRDSETQGLLKSGEKRGPGKRVAPPMDNLDRCLAIRGNGHYVVAHFGGVAGIVENFGEMKALAGGSSSSFTMYIYDAILQNPIVQSATGRQRELYIATMMKSGVAWIEVFKRGRDVKAIQEAVAAFQGTNAAFAVEGPQAGYDLLTRLRMYFNANPDLMQDPWGSNWRRATGRKLSASWDAASAAVGLRKVLMSEDLRDLVNPEILRLLSNQEQEEYESYRYKVAQIVAAAKTITAFSAKHADLIFRPGVVNFTGLGRVMTRIADFYAGHTMSDTRAVERFLRNCAHEDNVGVKWGQLKSREAGFRCEAAFTDAAYQFREVSLARSCRDWKDRLKKNTLNIACYDYVQSERWMGTQVPVILTTGVITGSRAVAAVKDYERKFLQDLPRPNAIPLNFREDVKFGYWTHPEMARRIQSQVRNPSSPNNDFRSDYKAQRLLHLGDPQWKTPFDYSPAEPGLSKYVPIDANHLSVGGWSDLSPVQVLKLAGCQEVVFLGRIGTDPFLTKDEPLGTREVDGVAEILNLQEADRQEWYATDYQKSGKKSSYVTGIQAADVVWCTDWNRFTDLEQVEMYEDAYYAKRYLNPRSKILAGLIKQRKIRVDNPGGAAIPGCFFP